MANRLNIQKGICPICKKEYIPARDTTLACSKICSRKVKFNANKKEYKCDCCGKNYTANKYNNSRHKINFCSEKCRSIFLGEKNRKPHSIVKGIESKQCSTCKKTLSLSRFKKDKSKWDGLSNVCSNCYKNYYRENWSKTEKGVLSRKQGKANRKVLESNAGKLLISTIKQVYDENIKKFKKLTCAYCLNICEQDWHLEHKVPLCRKGTNHKNNLAISCPTCNLSKGKKTVEEFMEYRNLLIKDGIIT